MHRRLIKQTAEKPPAVAVAVAMSPMTTAITMLLLAVTGAVVTSMAPFSLPPWPGRVTGILLRSG